MMVALLLALAAPQTAVDAERALAADAQAIGQWSAFRKWASNDAVMFVPRQVRAQDWLNAQSDPLRAVRRSPALSFLACDGSMAVNTGPTRGPDGRSGYFSTIWRQEAGSWRWIGNHGDFLPKPRWQFAHKPIVRHAACGSKPGPRIRILAFWCAHAPFIEGESLDGTLAYQWLGPCGSDGRPTLTVSLWNGLEWQDVIHDVVPPKPNR